MENLIPAHGGFRKLRSFQTARLVYDATVFFCDKFIPKNSRTHDQMVQAARSGVQNIAEGSLASATSKKTELKLTNVARASLGELLLDYEDYLRQNGLTQWDKDSSDAMQVRTRLALKAENEIDDMSRWNKLSDERFANIMICIINQASALLWKQIQRQEADFLKNGGFTERLYKTRKASRTES